MRKHLAQRASGRYIPRVVTLTERAAEALKGLLAEEGVQEWGLRLQVVGGGCSGFFYDLALAPGPDETDDVVDSRGVRLFVDRRARLYLEGLVVDYADTFRFENPHARKVCKCGASFTT